MKLARRGFWCLVGAALAGLLPALLLGAQIVRDTLETATLTRLADDAARLAAAPPRSLPPDAWLLAADGSPVAVAAATEAGPPEEFLAQLAPRLVNTPLRLKHPAGLFASQPLPANPGSAGGAVAVWQPAARIEARVVGILLRGIRDGAVLALLCVPAAWIGARLLLAPLALAASGAGALLDALREQDLAAETTGVPPEAAPILAAASPVTDPLFIEAAVAAAETLGRLAETEAAMLRAATPEVPV